MWRLFLFKKLYLLQDVYSVILLDIDLREEAFGMFFRRKQQKESYDPLRQRPVLKCNTCNSEQVAGFKDLETGAFHEVMFVRNADDLAVFRQMYGITGEIAKEY